MSDSNQKRDNNNLKDGGALWEKEGNNGNYFTGFVTVEGLEYPVIIFANNKATHPQAPTHRVYLRTDQEPKPAKEFVPQGQPKSAPKSGGYGGAGGAVKAKAPVKGKAPSKKDPDLDPEQEDDIPF